MVILDTNIVIDHLRQPKGRKSTLTKLAQETPKEILAISTITVQELYEGQSTNRLHTLNHQDFQGIPHLEFAVS